MTEEKRAYMRRYHQEHKRQEKEYRRRYEIKKNYKGDDPSNDLFEILNPQFFNNTYNGCSKHSDCLTCPRNRCIYD